MTPHAKSGIERAKYIVLATGHGYDTTGMPR